MRALTLLPDQKDQTMHTFMDAKLMAKLLRQGLADRHLDLSHSECLELVARQFGFANWNILSARIEGMNGVSDVIPEGWIRTGRSPKLYRLGVDKSAGAAWIESRSEHAIDINNEDFCTLMQSVDARAFRGKRMQLRASLKAVDVDGGVTIWFRVDGPLGSLRFENLERYRKGGPVDGDTDWTERQITLDVPEEATTLNYGFFLKGRGRGMARGFALDEVDASMPISTPESTALQSPTNLGFFDAA
jgi:hypothetical protein